MYVYVYVLNIFQSCEKHLLVNLYFDHNKFGKVWNDGVTF